MGTQDNTAVWEIRTMSQKRHGWEGQGFLVVIILIVYCCQEILRLTCPKFVSSTESATCYCHASGGGGMHNRLYKSGVRGSWGLGVVESGSRV